MKKRRHIFYFTMTLLLTAVTPRYNECHAQSFHSDSSYANGERDIFELVFGNDSSYILSKEKRNLHLSLVPAIAINPTNGFLFGAVGTAAWHLGDKRTTSPSNAHIGITYSTKKQFVISTQSRIYFARNKWHAVIDWEFQNSSQPTYGLGTGPSSARMATDSFEYEDGRFTEVLNTEQKMSYDLLRFYQTLNRNFGTYYYLGIGYHYDRFSNINDESLKRDTVPPIITSNYAYSVEHGFNPEAYTLSGLSLNASFDTRDNSINAYRGMYAHASFHINPIFLGSDKNSTSLWLEYRAFKSLSKKRPRTVLAFWLWGNFQTSGTLPYMSLPAIGWDIYNKSGRGYAEGRFRGESMIYGEAEFRFPISRKTGLLGGVVFVNAVTASSTASGIHLFDYIDPAAGIGLRILFNRPSRTNIQFDYGAGSYGSSGVYLDLQEAF